jgi:AraC-like DNA-binding protein
VNYIIIVGATQALLALGILFKNRKNNSQQDNILSYLLISIFLHLTITFVMNVFWSESKIHQQFNTFIALAYPGLLWCYLLYLENRGKPIDILIAMIPAMLTSIGYFSVAAYMVSHSGELPLFIKPYNSVSGYAYTILYIVYPIRILRRTKLIPTFWKLEKQMLQLIAILFLCIGTVFLAITFYKNLADISLYFPYIHLVLRIFIYSILAVVSISIIYVKINTFFYTHAVQDELQDQNVSGDSIDNILIKNSTFEQGGNTNIEPIQVVREESKKNASIENIHILEKLEDLMSNQKIFTDPDLTLDSLASKVGVSRHHLSETLNQYKEKSFYQYINEYRIKEVIALMDQYKKRGENANILSLAFQAGFHSKSSFNQYFKKVQGCTPSAYLKNKSSYLFSTQ